jgi:MFS family permease
MSDFAPRDREGNGAPDQVRSRPRERARSTPRSRQRPAVQPRRKTRIPLLPPTPEARDEDVDHQGQVVSIELRPVSGLFGRSDTVEITGEDESPSRLRLPAGLRRRKGEVRETSLLQNPDFRLLWWSRLLSQTAQGALLYALMILVIDLSNRSFYSALFVACSNVPSILLGLPAGMVVDNISRKHMMVMLNGFRFTFMLFMVATEPTLASVFAATIGIWIIHQFYSPSEASMLADLVPSHRYTSAQSLFNLALTISQAVGLAILAPIMLRLGGAELVFVLAGSLWLIAGSLTLLLPTVPAHMSTSVRPRRRGLLDTLTAGIQFVRKDRPTFEAILHDVLVSVGMSALVVIIPFYLERVLGTSKENTVFVFAPAAIGLVIGLRAAPILARIIGERYSAFISVAAFAVCIFMLGFIEQTYFFLNDILRLPLDQFTDWISISPYIFLTMFVSVPAGLAMSVVNVAARSILLQRTPGYVRGQVIATQGLIGNVLGLVPTLLTGLATDLFGVIPVAVGIAALILAGGIFARNIGRSTPPGETMVPAPAV